jgi:hypothetical protein
MTSIDPSILRDDPLLHRVWDRLGRPPRCRVVGGFVRDRLLGRPSHDLDLTIDGDDGSTAVPAERLATAMGVRAHLLGTPPHRIWRIETPELKAELWPLGDLTHEEDILRRDFTCNALSWQLPDGPLVDLVGGLSDLEGRRLRAISRSNLEDDPVRLLRGPRFLAQLTDFELDGRTRTWIRELAPALDEAPRERVGQELLILLGAPAASRGLRECLELGLAEPSAPAACSVDGSWLRAHLEALDRLNCRTDAGGTPAPHRPQRMRGESGAPATGRSGSTLDAARLALLFRAWGNPPDRDLAPYAWPRPVRENALRAATMLDEALATVDAAPADRRELAWLAGDAFPAMLTVARSIAPKRPGWRRWCRQWRRNPEALIHPGPLLSGDEIAAISGTAPGPELGALVQGLLRAQVRGEVRNRGGAVRWLVGQTDSR